MKHLFIIALAILGIAFAGGQIFIPLSTTSSKTIGESINLSTTKIVTLGKPGEADILRIEA